MTKIEICGTDKAESRLIGDFEREWCSDLEFIVAHTSGSTGQPKEIRLPKADMRVSARATNSRFGIGERSVMICPLSINYIAGKMMMARAFEAGCHLLFCHPSNHFLSDPSLRAFIDSHGAVDLVPVVPSQLSQIIENPHLTEGIHNIIIGGAPIDSELETSLKSQPGTTRYFATYGMTETCSHVALRPIGESLFSAMPGITFDIDARGCLIINAPQYSFRRLTTNDIVELLDYRTFIWRGRFDNVINSGGIKIFPEELERQLAPHITVPFFIIGLPHPKWGATPVIVAEESNTLSDSDIAAICKSVLPSCRRPSAIYRIKTIPLTSTGKIRRIPPCQLPEI